MEIPYRYKAKVLRVVDGDTIDVRVDLGMKTETVQRLRLAGINAPETYGVKKDSEEYKAGERAKCWLEQWIGNTDIVIETKKDKTGKYGRYIAIVWVEDPSAGNWVNINDQLVEEGLAEEKEY